MKPGKLLLFFGLAISAAWNCLNAAEPTIAATEGKPVILGSPGFQIANRLAKEGFGFNVLPYPGVDGVPLTWEKARKYNVIMLSGLGSANADMSLTPCNQETIATLRRFRAAGGGILFFPEFGQIVAHKPPQDEFLKPLGLTPLFNELPMDSDRAVPDSAMYTIHYALTDRILPSPISEGVKNLWFPVPTGRPGAQLHTIPFVADNNWTVVVKGGKSSFTKSGPLQADECKEPGTYASEVPLVVTREVGKGRIVYVGIVTQYLYSSAAVHSLDSVVLDKGLRGVPSDGYKLIANSLKWLAEPSLKSTELGGAVADEAILKNPSMVDKSVPPAPLFAWKTEDKFPISRPAYPGSIGARTTYSTGKADTAQWVKAAREQGLSYLVFLEDFKNLTAEKFESLKQDCKKLSTPEFTAIPGFTIDDEIGNHYFYFGTQLPYVDKKFLSEDGKVFVSRDSSQKEPYAKGQLSSTTLDYAYSLAGFKLTCGTYMHKQSGVPFANFFADWDAFAVITLDNGELVEDNTRGYLECADYGDGPLPVVLNLLNDPAGLAKTQWRTVLRLPENGGDLIAGKLGKDTKIADYFNQWNGYPDNPTAIYITDGPAIENWSYVGKRDYAYSDLFIWQNYRWKAHGKITASVGLREIRIYDGDQLFRRYLLNGEKEFICDLDITHDKQHNLILTATDTAGHRAVSGEHWDRNHRNQEFMCGDRNNQLSYGSVYRKDGLNISTGGYQALATPHKRIDQGRLFPASVFKNDATIGAGKAFDGGAGGDANIQAQSILIGADGKEIPSPNVSESKRLLHAGDVNIGEGKRERYFTDKIRVGLVWGTLWKTEPAKDYAVTRRSYNFPPDPESPLAVIIWRFQIKLLRDLPNKGALIATSGAAKSDLWTLRSSDTSFYAGRWAQTARSNSRALVTPFDRNAYLAMLDSPLGGMAVMPLTDGMQVRLSLPVKEGANARINLTEAATPQKKDETREATLLMLGIPRTTEYTKQFPPMSNEVVERFARDFGLLDGKPSYQINAQCGHVTNQRYILEIDSTKEQCFSGTLTGKLISSLPIAVSNLKDRWSAYLYDRTLKKARPLGVFENTTWATILLADKLDLFIGHPVISDNKELFIQTTQSGDDQWSVEVNNPTDTPVRTVLRINNLFDPLSKKKIADETVEIPAGQSVCRIY